MTEIQLPQLTFRQLDLLSRNQLFSLLEEVGPCMTRSRFDEICDFKPAAALRMTIPLVHFTVRDKTGYIKLVATSDTKYNVVFEEFLLDGETYLVKSFRRLAKLMCCNCGRNDRPLVPVFGLQGIYYPNFKPVAVLYLMTQILHSTKITDVEMLRGVRQRTTKPDWDWQ